MISKEIPRLAAVHDISGFGKASLTVVLPVLSSMGIQVCPLPTALLSTQTDGFSGYVYRDLTEEMGAIIDHWSSLGLLFSCVYSGFLGSYRQTELVSGLISRCADAHTLVVVDPVLGDDGEPYGPVDGSLIARMKELASQADVITPNVTEAALLLDEPWRPLLTEEEVTDWLCRLTEMGPSQAVLTGVPVKGRETLCGVYIRDSRSNRYWRTEHPYVPASYPGTGDLFASVMTGSILHGNSLPKAAFHAAEVVQAALRVSMESEVPRREGILLERVIPMIHELPEHAEFEELGAHL